MKRFSPAPKFAGLIFVRRGRLELPRLAAHAPQACLSTNSNICAIEPIIIDFSIISNPNKNTLNFSKGCFCFLFFWSLFCLFSFFFWSLFCFFNIFNFWQILYISHLPSYLFSCLISYVVEFCPSNL